MGLPSTKRILFPLECISKMRCTPNQTRRTSSTPVHLAPLTLASPPWGERRRGPSLFLRCAPVVLFVLCACSSLPGLRSAREADFASLRKTLEREKLEPDQVRRLARETLSAEIVRAKDREDRPFIRGLRACSSSVFGALDKRSQTEDGVGGEAALLLLEAGRLRGGVRKYKDAEDGAFRALAARSAKRDGAVRRGYFTDPDERVRRAALTASTEALDEEDVPELLEVSRLDPDPMSRSLAFSALSRIGGERVTLALKDRFDTAEEQLRLAIVDAWGKPALFDAGGRDQLVRLLTETAGFETLHAARILAEDEDETTRNLALGRLIQLSKDGTKDERRMAVTFLPSHREVTVRRLLELTDVEDEHVSVIAWARLLGNPHYRTRAQVRLLKWADSDSPVAFQARAALAAAGDERILPLMKKQSRAPEPETRLVAGNGLIRLGALTQVAPLLADENENVRQAIACRTLARPWLTQDKRP